ncbi:barstar family protein [Streptomyces sp. Amel2xC10]|uniref:barstar family protein n=1 Tax=Streptomyces sp. Amel2xC10 TaxID=1305826 RepID=UPI000A0908D8|nr:barstar family protein [Streptomyces sp. Amel2xC10]SMF77069.1 Barstar (barnase inhibitor) [Streptomyces sp. Amel2xC10]
MTEGNAIWWERQADKVHIIAPTDTLSAAHALPPTGLIYSARMRGSQMRDPDGVFTQFYEALRLPNHFGWNWNALRDCLTDLHWINAPHILITIDDADAVLSESTEERDILFRALNDAVKFWSRKPELPAQEKITFQAVLLSNATSTTVRTREA